MKAARQRGNLAVTNTPLLRPNFEFQVRGPAVSAQARNRRLLEHWKMRVNAAARAAWPDGKPPMACDVEVYISEFSDFATRDRDNMAKPVLDAMQGIVYNDDKRVENPHVEWCDVDGAYVVRHMSPVVAAALSVGEEFLWVRVSAHAPRQGSDAMSTPADAVEQRKLRSIARRYERDGYRVTMPRQGGSLPAFLEGFTPDLIAESDRERVVVEVKRSDAVRGSNDLLEIAERVSREPGWRFELVAIPPAEQVSASPAERIDLIENSTHQAMSAGLTDMAYVYAMGALEVLLEDLALQYGLKATKAPFTQIVRDLVSRGVISHEVFEKVEQARSVRNLLVHAGAEKGGRPSVADVEALLALARRMRSEMATATAD